MLVSSRGEKKRHNKVGAPQKVIIPKGMINPEETTVIEIPARLHRQPIVVAKHKTNDVTQGLLCSSIRTQNGAPPIINNGKAQSTNHETSQGHGGQHRACPKLKEDGDSYIHSLKTLNLTEEKERMELQHNLDAFQKARRKLLENTTKLASQDPTAKMYNYA